MDTVSANLTGMSNGVEQWFVATYRNAHARDIDAKCNYRFAAYAARKSSQPVFNDMYFCKLLSESQPNVMMDVTQFNPKVVELNVPCTNGEEEDDESVHFTMTAVYRTPQLCVGDADDGYCLAAADMVFDDGYSVDDMAECNRVLVGDEAVNEVEKAWLFKTLSFVFSY